MIKLTSAHLESTRSTISDFPLSRTIRAILLHKRNYTRITNFVFISKFDLFVIRMLLSITHD